jgi:iron(III) transport system substrate-binding protein
MKTNRIVQILAVLFLCGSAEATTDVWVYTSIYKEFIAPIQAAFEAKNPELKLQIYQAGSEKIQAKVEAELAAKKPQADLLVISDPFYAANLQKRGLLELESGAQFSTNYNSLVVLIVNKKMGAEKRPKNFSDLIRPELKNLVQMGSPLESGTMFAAVAYLSDKFGWDYFAKLRTNGIASNGGNSLVIQKVESGEKTVGIVLLENALASQKKGSPIEIVYPEDGAIAVPSVQAILKSSSHKDGAKKFAEFLLTKEAQKLLLNGYMYSVDRTLPPPAGAKPLNLVTKVSKPWTPESIAKMSENAKAIKMKFAEIVLE